MPPAETVWTVVVAGGSGRRFGGAKQFERLGAGDHAPRVIDVAVATARSATDGVVVVVPADRAVAEGGVAGGATRSESVRAGLAAVPDAATIVCVHDAARPYASTELFDAVIGAVAGGADGAVPGVPVSDTIKMVDRNDVVGVVDVVDVVDTLRRESLVAVQTPQAFRADVLRAAHASGGDATDDAGLVEQAGGRVVVVPGEPGNIKITHRDDLVRPVRPVGLPVIRVGQGFDVHRFSDDPDRPLVLGGCRFDGEPGLVGHSDADAVAHAVADALLGAAGLGDIGEHFPDTDPQWEGADSIELLRRVAALVSSHGWEVGNVDCSVICERPKIAPRRDEMQAQLSGAAGGPVTVSGRRAEGLGAIGRREGIACTAVAVLVRHPAEEVTT